MQGLIGKKLGMTQVFDGNGRRVAVTVIEVGPCLVVQRKTVGTDGYSAVQVGFGEQKESRMKRPAMGRFKKIDAQARHYLKEFAVGPEEEMKEGDTLTLSVFEGTTHVDISGITKGRGFQGVVKRHRMRGGPKTHGGHSERRVGSIGQCSYPARVVKGQRMPGHMGRVNITQQNLKVVELDGENNLMLVSGAVPGPTGSIVCVRKSLKKAPLAATGK